MSIDFRNKKWEKNFEGIERDYDNLVIWWKKHKSCKCNSEEHGIFCMHFNEILKETLGDKIQNSWQEKCQIGFTTINEVMRK